ncbi:DegT/DnrJ/EryC1/StrS family aminotransferase [Paludibaculum fermentans]|uniref:DegT/DnrJ/EryC1/StrS family aminotransferase n=1 Tax=Paludibaculum fermentans TaxID=1473598 RepID=UPI003EBCFFE0
MSGTSNIPFLDLVTPHAELKEELTAVFTAALSTAGFIGGPMVQGFEEDFAAYCGTSHCVGVGSGTDALRFAFLAAGIGPGDAVVTVPNTFIATTEAISQSGARPVFVDIDEATYNLDPALLQRYLETDCDYNQETRKLTDRRTGLRVAAVTPVHLYGQMADMDPILELAGQYNLIVIEDACQAHGAEYFSRKQNRWCKAGSMGLAAAFSFYPGKNLGACGEAGAVTTNDEGLARRMRMLRDHGQSQKYYHQVEGYNGRLDAIQAGILRVKLKHLPEWTQQRQAAAVRYRELFGETGARVILPHQPEWSKAVYHLFVVRVQHRDELMKQLGAVGIGTGIHYPVPLHLQEAYNSSGYAMGDFPVTERVAAQIVSLPMFPQLSASQQSRVVSGTITHLSVAVTS